MANCASLAIGAEIPLISECRCPRRAGANQLNVPAFAGKRGRRLVLSELATADDAVSLAGDDEQVRRDVWVETRTRVRASMGGRPGVVTAFVRHR